MNTSSVCSSLIDIIGASAGTGKTTRLASEFVKAVAGETTGQCIDPLRIIVCTFTNKAADELSARIRRQLLERGDVDAAHLVLAGYVGTVNSICGRLLKDYAFECGLPPKQDVIPEHMQNGLFAIATAKVLDAFAQLIEPTAERMGFTESASQSRFRKRTHWMEHVRQLCLLARANGISASDLRASAVRSWSSVMIPGTKRPKPSRRFVTAPHEPDEIASPGEIGQRSRNWMWQ
jgi:hypothetical protein